MITSSLFLINKGHGSNAEQIPILQAAKYLDEFHEENSPKVESSDNTAMFQLLSECKKALWVAVSDDDGLDGSVYDDLAPRIDAVVAEQK